MVDKRVVKKVSSCRTKDNTSQAQDCVRFQKVTQTGWNMKFMNTARSFYLIFYSVVGCR